MRKILYLGLVVALYSIILGSIFLHASHVAITVSMLVLFFILSIKIAILKRLFFVSAMIFLIITVGSYYFISYPYYRILADWIFYFLAVGVVTIIFEKI